MTQISPSSSGPQRAGSQYTLTCVALKTTSGLTSSAQIHWTGTTGAAIVTGSGIVLSGAVFDPRRTLQTVTFTSLSTAHAGVYSCDGTLSSPALTTDYRTTTSYTVTVSGIIYVAKIRGLRFAVLLICMILYMILMPFLLFSSTSNG